MNKPLTAQHSEWLSLVEVSGPFLTLPVLKRALPMGLDPTPLPLVDDLRVAWKEVGDDESLTPRWIRWVLSDLLELPDEVLKEGTAIGPAFTYTVPEHSVQLRPDFIVVDPDASSDAPARLLVTLLPAGTELDERLPDSKWSADAVDRMAELCRGARVRLGLVTNGDQWALVDAPLAGPTGVATWDANLWLEERITLDAFTTLLGVRRFFSVAPEDTLEAMLAESANAEAEVTDQLGKQVRQAVELLVDAMSRANRDRGGHLFDDLTAEQVYEAAVTVMMRLVFLLSAEERGLFLLGDETYDSTYAVSTLRGQLQEEANTYGEEVIARRTDAWHRLLATFRMVYGGAQHENLRLPAYGGSLFDPDRFPILEGRTADEPWRSSPSHPLPIDNRTVLHILGALQVLTFKDRRGVKEARRLSFRALDVEQIGHVYEGLLDHSAVRVDEVAVGLGGKKDPEIALAVLEAEAEQGRPHLVDFLADLTGLSTKAVDKALGIGPDPQDLERLTSACDNDHDLADRITPYLSLMRIDLAELPTVYLPDSMYVTQASDRRSSGTYYTPKALAEEVVRHALESLTYEPGLADGIQSTAENLRPSTDLLDLKICDMAMGSGAFLVAACRYLSGRLLEAWEREGLGAGDVIQLAGGGNALMPVEDNDREILARRLVADSCLYGVDRNPMAVEMAKLSMWLVTLAKDRPFTFVDHALRCGDSLLGVTDLRQLECLNLDPSEGMLLHGGSLFDPASQVAPLVDGALRKRKELESFTVMDTRDSERKAELLVAAGELLGQLKVIGNVVVGATLSTAGQGARALEGRLLSIAPEVQDALSPARADDDRGERLTDLSLKAEYWIDDGRPAGSPDRIPFHWPLEFPEVFLRNRRGFDAVVGNPPFLGGTRISAPFGTDFRAYIAEQIAHSRTDRTDLVVFFLLRAAGLVAEGGLLSVLATQSISEATSASIGTGALLAAGWTFARVESSRPWPGSQTLQIAILWMKHGSWTGAVILDGEEVAGIAADLRASESATPASLIRPKRLAENKGLCSLGPKTGGMGFILSPAEAEELIAADPRSAEVIHHYLSGKDLASSIGQVPSRYVIDLGARTFDSASVYAACMERLARTVRVQRLDWSDSRSRERESWWLFERSAGEFYARMEGRASYIAIPRVSKYALPVIVKAGVVPSEKVAAVPSEDMGVFGSLCSSLHHAWLVRWCATMNESLVYDPRSIFETFPFVGPDERLREAGVSLASRRAEAARVRDVGLTDLYNALHEPAIDGADVVSLRAAHQNLDEELCRLYGWTDINLDHGFYRTKRGDRFGVSPEAESELIDRLTTLNQVRSATAARRKKSSSRGTSRIGSTQELDFNGG